MGQIMDDLISRDAARNVINTWICTRNVVDRIKFIHADLSALPSIDAAPVRRGRWIYHDDDGPMLAYITCSVCGNESGIHEGNYYCHWCGARMDGEAKCH